MNNSTRRLLVALGAFSMVSCRDALPTAPGAAVEGSAAPGAISLAPAGPVFSMAPNPLDSCQKVSDVTAPASPWSTCLVSRTETQTQVRVTFEGLAAPLGKIAYSSFPGWIPLNSMTVGGTGRTHNLPSGSYSIFWSFPGEQPSQQVSSRDIVIDRPVYTFRLAYAAKTTINPTPFSVVSLPGGVVTLKGLDSGGSTIVTATGGDNYDKGPRPPGTYNPTVVYNKWDPLTVISPVVPGGIPDNRIHKANINGFEDRITVDDVYLTIINFRPVAIPGASYTAPQGTPVSFVGSASFDPVDAGGLPHPSGDAVTYVWSFGTGTDSSTVATPQYTYLVDGSYTASLRVTDPNGMSHTATVPVTITNVAPVIAARDTTVFAGTPLQMPITLTDPGSLDGPWSYDIDWGDGTPVVEGTITTWASSMAPSVGDRTHTYAGRGSYTVTITASDAKGGTRTETRTVTVPNRPPVAAFTSGATSGAEGTAQTYVAGSIDPDADPLSHGWIVRLQSSVNVLASGAGSSFAYTFPDNGTYLVELTANDGLVTHTAVRTVTIANVAPTAEFTAPSTGTAGQAFSISFSNPADPGAADGPFKYSYDCGAGYGPVVGATSTNCTPAAAGTLGVKGKVVDKDGASTEYTASVDVVPANSAPVPGTISGPPTSNEGQSLSYSAQGWTDPDPGQTLSYTWTFQKVGGGGWTTTATGPAVNVTFPDDGSYEITLTAKDSGPAGGLSTTATREILVTNVAPTATLSAPVTVTLGDPVPVSLSGIADPGVNDVLAYSFTCGSSPAVQPSTPNATCVPVAAGSYSIQATISDGDGGSNTYSATVGVVPPNAPPSNGAISVTGPLTEGSPTYFQTTGWIDEDESSLSYEWELRAGGPTGALVVPTVSGLAFAHSFADNGAYHVKLIVRDAVNQTVSRTESVTIGNVEPSAVFNAPAAGTVGQSFPISLTAPTDPSSADATAGFTYSFRCGTGTATPFGPPSPHNCTPAGSGLFAVEGRIRDKDLGIRTYTATVAVGNANSPPAGGSITGSTLAPEGYSITFSAVDWQDLDGDPLTYQWAAAGASPGTGSGSSFSHSFPHSGTHIVTLTVSDGTAQTVATRQVTITNVAPAVTANGGGSIANGGSVTVGSSFTDADPQDSPWSWAIDWGDGRTSSGTSISTGPLPTATQTYHAAGSYTVTVSVTDRDGGTGTATVTVSVTPTGAPGGVAWVERDLTLNGQAQVLGSIRVMGAYNATFNGQAEVTGDLFIPGIPLLIANGRPDFGGTVQGSGAAWPTGHRVTLNGGAGLRYLVNRTDPTAMPIVGAPPAPTGTRNVTINKQSDNPGNFATIRNLTLNGKAGTVAVPPGSYGTFTANSGTTLRLGVPGSSTPTTYNFETLVLNSKSMLEVVGPVIVTVRNGVTVNGNAGTVGNPAWLIFRVSNGGFTVNSQSKVDAYIVAPTGAVILNGGSRLSGGLVARTLTMQGNSDLNLLQN